MSENTQEIITYEDLGIANKTSAIILFGISAIYNDASSYFGVIHKGASFVAQDRINNIAVQNLEVTLTQKEGINITYKYGSPQEVLVSIFIMY